MEKITIEEIIRWINGVADSDIAVTDITGISTDTRSIKPGELFIPLMGENFDGHNYVEKALGMGAAAFLTHREIPLELKGRGGIRVKDTQRAYQDIARGYLKKYRIPVVAITGSNGKTTTKDYVAHVLSQKFNVVKTEKNFNNEVGVPRTVLQLNASVDVLVIELAMRGRGQIRDLARIVEPDISVITNVGESHFELLGSYEAIAMAKSEILEFIRPAGFSVLNADDRWYWYMVEKTSSIIKSFGIKRKADVKLLEKKSLGIDGFELKVDIGGIVTPIHLPLPGEHNIYNTLASVTVGRCLGMSVGEICRGIATLAPTDKRFELKKASGGWVVINDSYNASPTSMGNAIKIVGELSASGRKIAVLGDMLELGAIEEDAHRGIGEMVHKAGIDLLFVKGKLGAEIAVGAGKAGMQSDKIYICKDSGEIIGRLKTLVREDDIILVKGSRLMKMEEVAENLL